MRGKLAKALRREAQRFALETGRTENKITTVDHGPVLVEIPAEEMRPDGTPLRFERLTDVHVDGPRFFMKALKRAHRKGLLKL